MKRAVVIYHSADLDGHCSGAIARMAMMAESRAVQMIGWNHGEDWPVFGADSETKIVVTDLAFPAWLMHLWADTAGELIWIDHHITSIIDLQSLVLPGRRDVEKAACELAWEHFWFSAPPTAVRLLGRFDVWDHRDDRVLPFQYAMRAEDGADLTAPESDEFWAELFHRTPEAELRVQELVAGGRAMLRYEKRFNALVARLAAFECEFAGLHAIALTRCKGGSLAFEGVYQPSRHQLMITCYYDGRGWNYSLYTTHEHVNCGDIAKSFGGGGHLRAAGFRWKSFLLGGTPE